MKSSIRFFLSFLMSFIAFFLSAEAMEAKKRPPLIVLSIDGLGASYLEDHQLKKLGLKNLQRLKTEGNFAQGVENVLPSLTYPAHTTLLTGVSPAKHGIFNNVFFDPSLTNTDRWYWFEGDIKVSTLWDLAKEEHLLSVNLDWPVSLGAPVSVNIPQYWQKDSVIERKMWYALSDGARDYLMKAQERLGEYPLGKWDLAADQIRGRYIADVISQLTPDFFTAYFSSVDEAAHHAGLDSLAHWEAMQGIDRMIGDIDKQAQLSYPQGYFLAVVSDHGFAKAEKEIRLNALLHDLGLIELDSAGNVISWKAMAWHAEGVAALILKNPGDLGTRKKLEDGLRLFAERHPEAIDKILTKDQIQALGGFPEAILVVSAKEHFKFSFKAVQPIIGASASYPATHGFLADKRAMDAVFLVKGPGLKRGKNLGRVAMIDIAPSLAFLMGKSLSEAEGRNVIESSLRLAH